MPEKHDGMGGMVIVAVVQANRGGYPGTVEDEHFCGDEGAVVAIGDGEHAERAEHQGECVHFASLPCL